jgi:hypothetical protein
VVLSIAVNALDSDHPLLADLGREATPSANSKNLAAKYRSAAMRCLSADQFMWRHNLHTVQALVLLIYAISHTSGPSWALLGLTFHMCVSLGCHIDPSQLNIDPVRGEQRRRVWAGLMLLYTIQNTALGNLAPMKLTAAATVRLPADLDDEDITLQGLSHRYMDGAEHRPPTKMSYILLKFKLYTLASDICAFSRSRGDLAGLNELENRICEEEQEHKARFADGQQLPLYHHAHQYILNNYIHYLRLILHRPYLETHGPSPIREPVPREQVLQSRGHCRTAAMVLLANHEDLCCNVALRPYRWFVYGLGSFQAFLAASTLAVLLASDDDVTVTHRPQFLRALEKCQTRFEHLAARSDVCAKAAPILRRLLYNPRPTHPRNLEPPPLTHHSSSISDDSERNSVYDGQSSGSRTTPMVPHTRPNFAYDVDGTKMDMSWYNVPPQLYDLMSLPAEQWIGGAGALAWDWNTWLDVVEPQATGPDAFVRGPSVMM